METGTGRVDGIGIKENYYGRRRDSQDRRRLAAAAIGLGGRTLLRAQAGEELGRRFVGGVLGDEAAGEGAFEDRPPQGLAALQRGVELPLVPLDGLKLLVQQAHDLLLLGEGAEGDGDRFESLNTDLLLRDAACDEAELFPADHGIDERAVEASLAVFGQQTKFQAVGGNNSLR